MLMYLPYFKKIGLKTQIQQLKKLIVPLWGHDMEILTMKNFTKKVKYFFQVQKCI